MELQRRGLLLGAGFSAPAGMPMVRQLTSLLFMQQVKRLRMRAPRFLLSDMAFQRYAGVVLGKAATQQYEQFVGDLEGDCLDSISSGEDQLLFLQMADRFGFLELIHETLSDCQRKSADLMVLAQPHFRGLAALAYQSRPLWVFSLNHDCFTELMASLWRIPLATDSVALRPPGLLKSVWNLLCGNRAWSSRVVGIRQPPQEPATASERFFAAGQHGMNVVKLHGSLNHYIDVTNPKQCRFLQFAPNPHLSWVWNNFINTIEAEFDDGLLAALNHKHFQLAGERLRIRGTILSGMHKFTSSGDRLNNAVAAPTATLVGREHGWTVMYEQQNDYLTPLSDGYLGEQLKSFHRHLPDVDHLIAIGYSLGDAHVNDAVRDWLKADETRSLSIIRPAFSEQERQGCDRQERGIFGDLIDSGRVLAVRQTTTEFLAGISEPTVRQSDATAYKNALDERRTQIDADESEARAIANRVYSVKPETVAVQLRRILDGGLPDTGDLGHALMSAMHYPGAEARQAGTGSAELPAASDD